MQTLLHKISQFRSQENLPYISKTYDTVMDTFSERPDDVRQHFLHFKKETTLLNITEAILSVNIYIQVRAAVAQ